MAENQPPSTAPRRAHLSLVPREEFTASAALFSDALGRLQDAQAADERGDLRGIEQNVHATGASAFECLESYINMIVGRDVASCRGELSGIELDVLEEKETFLDEHGNFQRRARAYPFEARFLFIARYLTGKAFERNSVTWRALREAREQYDMWNRSAPQLGAQPVTVAVGLRAIHAIAGTVDELSRMMGEDPPYWLANSKLPNLK